MMARPPRNPEDNRRLDEQLSKIDFAVHHCENCGRIIYAAYAYYGRNGEVLCVNCFEDDIQLKDEERRSKCESP